MERIVFFVIGVLATLATVEAANITSMAEILANIRAPRGPKPVVVKLPAPPALVGALAPNNFLTKAQAYALNQVDGPESLLVVNRYIYTGLANGWVVEIKPDGTVRQILRMSYPTCEKPNQQEGDCGRPMGIRKDHQGYLIVADAYSGIFKVDPRSGNYLHLVDAKNLRVNGKQLGYINDLAVAKDGTIFFTSSSNKWKPSQYLNIIFEGETSGRVLVYNPRETNPAKRVQELVTNLHYPNGLELGPNEEYLLIAEGGRSRIFRAWIGAKHPKLGKIETFAENLPGFVDNIRISPRKTFWVGLSRARHSKLPSILDTHGNKPDIRANLINLVKSNMVFDSPNFGIVVELNDNGTILRSLQDPNGSTYNSVTELAEENDILFLASKGKKYVGIIDLTTIPKAQTDEAQAGNNNGALDIDAITDPNLKDMLKRLKTQMAKYKTDQMSHVILVLAKKLYEMTINLKSGQDKIKDLQQQLAQQGGSSPQPGGGGTSVGPSGQTTPTPGATGGSGGSGGTGGSSPSAGAQTTPQATSQTTQAPQTTSAGAGGQSPDQIGGGSNGGVDGNSGLPSPSNPNSQDGNPNEPPSGSSPGSSSSPDPSSAATTQASTADTTKAQTAAATSAAETTPASTDAPVTQ